MHNKYLPKDHIRENCLKSVFGTMTPIDLADYSRKHPRDPDFHEYMTRYATPETNEEVLSLLNNRYKPLRRKRDRVEEMV